MSGLAIAMSAAGILAGLQALSPVSRLRRRGSRSALPTVGLAPGTLLYHGTQAPEDFEHPDGPAWFTTSEAVARRFVGWNRVAGEARPRLLVYRVTAPLRDLILINGQRDMQAMMDHLAGVEGDLDHASPRELAEEVCQSRYNGWHIRANYPDGGSDTLLCDPEDWLELVEEISL